MTPNEKVINIALELKDFFVEKSEVVDGMLLAILSGEHLVLLGPPGVAKSMLCHELCRRIEGANYFQWLLTKFSTPEEVFGPISLKALEQDAYRRITVGKLPEAHIAFLDEVFKANSAILNALLTLVNERKFHNDGIAQEVPLISLFGASNELPEGEELAALYDRFLLRYVVDYIIEDSEFGRMLGFPAKPSGQTTITLEELKELQAQVCSVNIPQVIFEAIIKIRKDLRSQGVIASDRRYRWAMKVLQAAALIEGRNQVELSDLRVLQHCLWGQPSEIKTVQRVVLSVSNPFEEQAVAIFDQAVEIHANALQAGDGAGGAEANTKLKELIRRLEELENAAVAQGAPTTKIIEVKTKVYDLNKEVVEKCLGVKF